MLNASTLFQRGLLAGVRRALCFGHSIGIESFAAWMVIMKITSRPA